MTQFNMAQLISPQPIGQEVLTVDDYAQAQRAVDALSDSQFPVENVQIIGTELRLIENVTGRLTLWKAVGAGAASGAWFGVMIGLLWLLLDPQYLLMVVWATLMGALFGAIAAGISYQFTGGKRDFTSVTRVVPTKFSVYCRPDVLADCRRILIEKGVLRSPVSAPVDMSQPPQYGERITPAPQEAQGQQ